MRLDIRYRTSFRYQGPVTESQNELRACPATDHRQAVVHYDVVTDPASRVVAYTDHWGTSVDTFGIRLPHDHLDVVASATVETAEPDRPPADVPLTALADQRFRDRYLEFLEPSSHVVWGDAVQQAAAAATADRSGVVDVVEAVHDRVADLEYRTGATSVGVTVDEVFACGVGVCQDFAHLATAMLRSRGIPARYVSGYLFAVDDATGEAGEVAEVEVETHAWVEAAIPGWGWYAVDPTNRQAVGERHVTIGRGRDYDDVAPFRGVFTGDQHHELQVLVSMRRLAVTARTAPTGPMDGAAQQ